MVVVAAAAVALELDVCIRDMVLRIVSWKASSAGGAGEGLVVFLLVVVVVEGFAVGGGSRVPLLVPASSATMAESRSCISGEESSSLIRVAIWACSSSVKSSVVELVSVGALEVGGAAGLPGPEEEGASGLESGFVVENSSRMSIAV